MRAEHFSKLMGQRVIWLDRLGREATSDLAATSARDTWSLAIFEFW
jgi:hypothetical protein